MPPLTSSRAALAIVHVAAHMVPRDARSAWQSEWEAELASLATLPPSRRRAVRRALGAFVDAFWLRQRGVADFDWIDDLRVGVRQLTAHAGFAVTAIGILAMGLGATVTMFSVTDQVLLRRLPYPSPERIVTLWQTRADSVEPLEVAPGDFLDWRHRARSFAFLAGVDPWSLDVYAGARPEVWFSAKVTEGFFETFGVAPLAGRFFAPDEYQAGRDNVVVISESFWRRRFAADPTVIGRAFGTEDGPVTVVGVVPASFEPRLLATAAGYREIWQPKAIQEYERSARGGGYWAVVGRLRDDVSLETARSELTAIAHQLATEYPRTNSQIGAHVVALRDHLVGNVRLAVSLLGGAIALVLLIACVNVANLLLARGSGRQREMAVRVALGARRSRLIQQLLLESLLIAMASGLTGCVVATWALRAITQLGPPTVPWLDTLHLDWRAMMFAALMVGAVAVMSGLLPAYRIVRTGLATAGRNTSTGDRAQHRLRATLAIAEVAMALVLVAGTALLVRSFISLMNVDPGFDRARVLVAQVFIWDHNPTPADRRRFFNSTTERMRALPSVQAVGAVSAMPFIESNINIQGPVTIVNRPAVPGEEPPRLFISVASAGYFETMRIPVRAGRAFDERDGAQAKPVTVVSDSFARRYWPAESDALGQKLRLRFTGTSLEVEIVGVVGSLRHDALDRAARPEMFLPFEQVPFGSITFVVRAAADASALVEPVRATIWSVDPNQTIYRSATLDELVQKTISPRRFALGIIVGFAAVALFLAVVGVYGVLSAIMTARLREVGLRVALGASRGDIVRLVIGRGLAMTATGLIIGLAGALGAGRLLQSFLFGVTPHDPTALAASTVVMLSAALAACYVPARRAAAADPIAILRTE